MGGTERPAGDEGLAGLEQADDAVNLRGLKGFFQSERRKNGGETFGEHRFAGAGRANQQNVVATSGGDFEGAFDGFLAFDIDEVNFFVVSLLEDFGDIDLGGRDLDFAFEKTGGFAEV